MDVSIRFSPQLRDIGGRFAKAEGATLDKRRSQLQEGLRRLVQLARDQAPRRSGNLAKSITFRTFMSEKTLLGNLYAANPLSTFIQRGTRAHLIKARGGVLAFTWDRGPRGAGQYFFKSVNHPGTRPNPYMERAVKIWLPEANELLRSMAKSFAAYVTA